jgi:hypothetical protein
VRLATDSKRARQIDCSTGPCLILTSPDAAMPWVDGCLVVLGGKGKASGALCEGVDRQANRKEPNS